MLFSRKWATAAFEPHEPLDASRSPVSWISNEVWQRRKQWSRFPLLKSEADDPSHLVDAYPVVVDGGWRESRPPCAAHPPAPPALSIAEARAALEKTEDAGAFWNPVSWPVCCSSLTILVLTNPTRAELEAVELALGSLEGACPIDDEGWRDDLNKIRAGLLPENGVNVFQCGTCGRSYGHHSHT